MTDMPFITRPPGAWISIPNGRTTLRGQVVHVPGTLHVRFVDDRGTVWNIRPHSPTSELPPDAITSALRDAVARGIQQIADEQERRRTLDAKAREAARSVSLGSRASFTDRTGAVVTGTVEKINAKSVVIRVGTIAWRVHPSFLTDAPQDPENAEPSTLAPTTPTPPVGQTTVNLLDVSQATNPFYRSGIEGTLLEALFGVYSALSPENLTGDGELPRSEVTKRHRTLERQRRGIEAALGYAPNEDNLWDFMMARRDKTA